MRTAELKFGFSYDAGDGETVVPVFVHSVEHANALVELREDTRSYITTDSWMRNAQKGTMIQVPLMAVRFTD